MSFASPRAGNVIGGGDWAVDRLIPDAIRAFPSKQELVVRFPQAVRPWQHVLEPVSGTSGWQSVSRKLARVRRGVEFRAGDGH